MLVSDPDVSRPRLVRDATFLEADRREIKGLARDDQPQLTAAVIDRVVPPLVGGAGAG